jgi:rod shape-determining protein MreB
MVVRADEPYRPLLVGHEARELTGRSPVGMLTVRPLHDGVIVDLESARAFIVAIIRKARRRWWGEIRPREAGLRRVGLLPEPVAGALGCGVDPLEPRAHLVVDVGGGTAEVTGFCFGGVLATRSCRVAGDEMTLALYQHLRTKHQIIVGELTVEEIKVRIDGGSDEPLVVDGRDAVTGRARLVTLETDEVMEALRPTTSEIIQTLTGCLEELPAQAAGDIMGDGVLAIGGGSLLRGFTSLLEEAFGFSVKLAERPLTCVAEGAAACLTNPAIISSYGG